MQPSRRELTRRLLFASLLLLSAAGVALASFLLQEHLEVFAGGLSQGLFCGGAGLWDCNQVAAHPFSMLFGHPVALWGMLYFLLVLGLSTSAAIYRGPDRKAFLAFGTIVCTLGFAFDLFLGYVMVTQIGAVCLNCIATYAISGLLAICFWKLDRELAEPVRWSKLVPDALALRRGGETDYFRFWVKSGVSLLFVSGLAIAWVSGVVPFNRVHAEMGEQIWEFLGRMRAGPPNVDMRRFDGQPSLGRADAQLTIAVAGDFQCGYCRALAAHLEALHARYPDDLRLIYVNSPLSSKCNPAIPKDLHQEACWLAEAAECAAAQGSFWEFHDHLYKAIPLPRVGRDVVLEHLERIGLNREEFMACMASSLPGEAVSADVALCKELGMTTTPALVINGYLHRGSMMPQVLSELVNFLIVPKENATDSAGSVTSLDSGATGPKRE